MFKIQTAVIVFMAVQPSLAQRTMMLIKAISKSVDIRDKGVRRKNAWTIVPEAKPDVYITSAKNEKVTFYTDLDSISFTVVPNGVYNFVILLNG